MTVRCPGCTKNRRGCSFRYYDFGIGKPPTLLKTRAGDLRRAEQVAAKQKGSQKKSLVAGNDISISVAPTVTTRAAAKGKGAMVQAPSMRKAVSEGLPSQSGSLLGDEDQAESGTLVSPEPGSSTERVHLPDPWARPNGRSERVFFEDILRFQRELFSPSRTSLSLSWASAEVKTIATREKMQVQALALFTEDRQPLMERLVARLDAEAALLAKGEAGPNPETQESDMNLNLSKNADSSKEKEDGNEETKGADEVGTNGGEVGTMG